MWLHVGFQSEATCGTIMKTLCVLLLAVLGRSLSEGGNVSVCELTTQLRSAGANCSQLNASDPNVLAQIVCYADILSNLSTSAQTNETQVIRDGEKGVNSGENQAGGHSGENQAGGHSGENQAGGHSGENHAGGHSGENHASGHSGENQAGGHSGENHASGHSGENHAGGHSGENHEGKKADPRRHSRSSEDPDHGQNHPGSGSAPSSPQPICTLYGIFQLSSCQACSNGVYSSPNICNLNCSELLDDDISNDVVCLFKVMFSVPSCSSMWQELGESLGKNQKNQSGQCSNVSAYMCK